jgi:hypothetical protein
MKKKIIFGAFALALITINISKNADSERNTFNMVQLLSTASADPEGVEACYDSKTYYSDTMPGCGYKTIYGEECYNNAGDACGKNQSCELLSGATATSCYDLSC